MADRHRAEVIVTAAQILHRQKFRRLPVIAKRFASQRTKPPICGEIPALFVGIDASLYGEGAEGVVRLDDDLVDGAELLVFFEKFELTLEARELCPECEADCLSGFVNEPQFFFGELVVVDY